MSRNTSVAAEYVNACDIEYADAQMTKWRQWRDNRAAAAKKRGEHYMSYYSVRPQYPGARVDVQCHVCGKWYDIQRVAYARQQRLSKKPRCKSCAVRDSRRRRVET